MVCFSCENHLNLQFIEGTFILDGMPINEMYFVIYHPLTSLLLKSPIFLILINKWISLNLGNICTISEFLVILQEFYELFVLNDSQSRK